MNDTPQPTPIFDQATKQESAGSLSPDQLRAHREEWVKHGHDPAKFDAALLAEGVQLAAESSREIAEHHTQFGIPERSDPAAYSGANFGELAKQLPTERLANVAQATREWASSMRFNPELGVAMIERIAEVGPKVAAMTEAGREQWALHNRAFNLRHAGSEQALEQLLADAKMALQIAGDNAISAKLATSILSEPWILRTLATHGRAFVEFNAKFPRK